MSANGILELELPTDKLELLQAQAQYQGKDVGEFVTSIIDEWLYKEQLMQTTQKQTNSDKHVLSEAEGMDLVLFDNL